MQPHRRQPTRLPRPWDSPGKNTGVGWHFLFQCMKVRRESEVTQSCLTLSDPMDCSPPGSSVHGIFQARVLEWGAIAFSDSQFSMLSRLPWWLRQQRIHLQYRRPGFDSWVGKIPWRREWQPTPAMDRGAWQVIVHGVAKSWTQLSDTHTHTHTHRIIFPGWAVGSAIMPPPHRASLETVF